MVAMAEKVLGSTWGGECTGGQLKKKQLYYTGKRNKGTTHKGRKYSVEM